LTPRGAAAQSGRWSYRTPDAGPLDYVQQTIVISATDAVGNRTTDPLNLVVTVDNVAPALTATQVIESLLFTPTVRALVGTVQDGSSTSEVHVRVQTPVGDFYGEPAAQTGGAWQYDLHPLMAGRYTLWASAVDAMGNVTTVGPFEIDVKPLSIVFLPLVARNHVSAPDLVVERIVATPNDVQVVIRNVGSGPVTDEFWVETYIDPDTEPTAVNQTWDQLGKHGLVWGVTADALPALTPGGALTLTVGDAYYWPSLSKVKWPLADETQVWVQVDSAGLAADYGGVLETHEIFGEGYNNVMGPIDSVMVAAGMASAPGARLADDLNDSGLPQRRETMWRVDSKLFYHVNGVTR
jgi:hypothetical protein